MNRMFLLSVALVISIFTSLQAFAVSQDLPIVLDPAHLDLASVNALVTDAKTGEVLFAKNPEAVTPIASVTKLMGAMVVLDSDAMMDEILDVQTKETKELKNVFSRVRVGSKLKRNEMLQLSLMSSENRAAASLAFHYLGGTEAFVAAMNAKAKALGMKNTRFVEPTGLSEKNVSSAEDLAKMLVVASGYELIRKLSTVGQKDSIFSKPKHTLNFVNTNPLVRNNKWNVMLSKTGFINEAGHCLVMLTKIQDREVMMVLLDSFGKRSHIADAARIRQWIETGRSKKVPAAAKSYARLKSQT
jgi:D-alanyl-D-alanine endopeptidase (penicillin-binding protein 7)